MIIDSWKEKREKSRLDNQQRGELKEQTLSRRWGRIVHQHWFSVFSKAL